MRKPCPPFPTRNDQVALVILDLRGNGCAKEVLAIFARTGLGDVMFFLML